MFGYIRPVREELKVREFELFRQCYCGMCHCLGRQYGFPARFILNYDFTYLAMLLWEPGCGAVTEERRCIMSPCRKKRCCVPNEAMVRSSGYSVILAWWKLNDEISDNGFFKSLPARLAKLALRRSYNRASALYPDFTSQVRKRLSELSQLEAERCSSLDRTADSFAALLASAAEKEPEDSRRRALSQLLYHTGRWIYITDACDDVEKDSEDGAYNAAAQRFGVSGGKLSDEAAQSVSVTLEHSKNLCGAAFELMPETVWTSVIRNIICLGMPEVSRRVLAGIWKKPRRSAPK